MSFGTTITEPEDDSPGSPSEGPPSFVLTVVWCRDEPWRIGEALYVVPKTSEIFFGRGPALASDKPKSHFVQNRPGACVPCPPLSVTALSRYQLALRALAPERCEVRNLGRCRVLKDGEEFSVTELAPGDLLQIGRQLLFLCSSRPGFAQRTASAGGDFGFGSPDAHGLVGESFEAWRLRQRIAFAAERSGHVLIVGETGTGKELVARAIHEHSSRNTRPLLSRNAATIPEMLVDAELFGNAKNYPNAGMPERLGIIGAAHQSTLFLDEFAELPLTSQAHLLRVLDAGEYQRLGETHVRQSDFRLVGATNRDPGTLKHDVLARFALRIEVPGLNARKEDIPLLVRHLLRQAAESGDRAASRLFPDGDLHGEPQVPLEWIRDLLRLDYTSHVRELRTRLIQALERGEIGTGSDAPETAVQPPPPATSGVTPEHIQRVLDENNGSVEQARLALHLSSRFVLLRLIKRHGLEIRRRPGKR